MKLKIAVRILGHKPPDFDSSILLKWRSSLWEIFEGQIETLPLNGDCDLDDWGYSDHALSSKCRKIRGADISVFVLNVPLQHNYFARRIQENIVCISLFEVAEVLRSHNIPVENLILRSLYSCTLIYARKKTIPPIHDLLSIAHHETKGCIFDMAGIKTDVVFSCHRPILCDSCKVASNEDQVSNETLTTLRKEIQKIQKRLFYRISDWVRRSPILALAASALLALLVGIVGSIAASYIYEYLGKEPQEAAKIAPQSHP